MSSMLTLKDYHNLVVPNGDLGIEIEVEFERGHRPAEVDVVGSWRVTHDDSLNNGYEYVSRQPFKEGADKLEKIKALSEYLNGFRIVQAPNTSVHVHRNVCNFTPLEIWNSLTTYWLIEEPLITYCGAGRKGNMFCLSLTDAEAIIKYAQEDLKARQPFSTLTKAKCKYGGQALHCLASMGSIEYRTLRGTTDPHIINTWSSLVYHISERARRFKDPSDVLDKYAEFGPDIFLDNILPASFVGTFKIDKDYKDKMKKSALFLCELAYYHDWDAWQKKLSPPDPSELKYIKSLRIDDLDD